MVLKLLNLQVGWFLFLLQCYKLGNIVDGFVNLIELVLGFVGVSTESGFWDLTCLFNLTNLILGVLGFYTYNCTM